MQCMRPTHYTSVSKFAYVHKHVCTCNNSPVLKSTYLHEHDVIGLISYQSTELEEMKLYLSARLFKKGRCSMYYIYIIECVHIMQ